MLKRVVFSGMMVLITLLFLETAARAILSYDPIFFRIKGDDRASGRLLWHRRITREHCRLNYEFSAHSPERGWAMRPNLRDKVFWKNKIINTNSRGIRSTEEYSYEKPPDKLRILTIGDSFTLGDEVSDDETYSFYLQQMIPGSEVINMGVSAYGHDQMLLYLREEGVKYHPDIVVLGFVYYDIKRNITDFFAYKKPRFEIQDDRLALKDTPVPSPETLLWQEIFRPKILDLATIFYNRYAWETGINDRKAKRISEKILDEIIRTIRETGAIPVFVYLVDAGDFRHYFHRKSEGEKYFYEYCQGRDVYCTSVRPAFLEEMLNGNYVDTWGHWDAEGHYLAASVIQAFLKEEDLLALSRK